MFEDSNQPGFFRAATGKFCAGLERSQESFLNHIFRLAGIAQTEEGELKEIVAVFFHPTLRVDARRRF